MKLLYLSIVLLCVPVTVTADELSVEFFKDSVFVTNLLYLQNEISSSHYDKFAGRLDSVTVIRDKNIIEFLEVVQILSGINYWFNGWIGHGITQHKFKLITNWYIHHRHLLSDDILVRAYELVRNKPKQPYNPLESNSEWDEHEKKCDDLRIK